LPIFLLSKLAFGITVELPNMWMSSLRIDSLTDHLIKCGWFFSLDTFDIYVAYFDHCLGYAHWQTMSNFSLLIRFLKSNIATLSPLKWQLFTSFHSNFLVVDVSQTGEQKILQAVELSCLYFDELPHIKQSSNIKKWFWFGTIDLKMRAFFMYFCNTCNSSIRLLKTKTHCWS
jgi:hypothetical protein